jgi:hypothetical protein
MEDDITIEYVGDDNNSEFKKIVEKLSKKTAAKLGEEMSNSLDEFLSCLKQINSDHGEGFHSSEIATYTMSVTIKFCLAAISTAANNFIKKEKKSIFLKTTAEKFHFLINALDEKSSYV